MQKSLLLCYTRPWPQRSFTAAYNSCFYRCICYIPLGLLSILQRVYKSIYACCLFLYSSLCFYKYRALQFTLFSDCKLFIYVLLCILFFTPLPLQKRPTISYKKKKLGQRLLQKEEKNP
uniref:PK145R n=1 Tax=African swine fever virus TaxID=10497 RepID=A0A6G7KUA6_ASF